jgi:pyridoxine kinase
MGRVLAISSHVVRGHVGLAATVPALQSLGHEVWALPTVMVASRPGLGTAVAYALPSVELDAMLAGLEADGCWAQLDAVITGYFPSPQAVGSAARAIARIKAAKPGVLVCVDPILGDAGRLYVAPETAAAIRDTLLPLATLATPNRFELSWLTGPIKDGLEGVSAAARRLHLALVAVTSAAWTLETVATALVTAEASFERLLPCRPGIPNGAGDLFAGLLLGRLVHGTPAADALTQALADLDGVLRASEHQPSLALSALGTRT